MKITWISFVCCEFNYIVSSLGFQSFGWDLDEILCLEESNPAKGWVAEIYVSCFSSPASGVSKKTLDNAEAVYARTGCDLKRFCPTSWLVSSTHNITVWMFPCAGCSTPSLALPGQKFDENMGKHYVQWREGKEEPVKRKATNWYFGM